jgi:hypothetical protein
LFPLKKTKHWEKLILPLKIEYGEKAKVTKNNRAKGYKAICTLKNKAFKKSLFRLFFHFIYYL